MSRVRIEFHDEACVNACRDREEGYAGNWLIGVPPQNEQAYLLRFLFNAPSV